MSRCALPPRIVRHLANSPQVNTMSKRRAGSWARRVAVDRPGARERARRAARLAPGLLELEDRTLMSYGLPDIVMAYNKGVANVAAIVDKALGVSS